MSQPAQATKSMHMKRSRQIAALACVALSLCSCRTLSSYVLPQPKNISKPMAAAPKGIPFDKSEKKVAPEATELPGSASPDFAPIMNAPKSEPNYLAPEELKAEDAAAQRAAFLKMNRERFQKPKSEIQLVGHEEQVERPAAANHPALPNSAYTGVPGDGYTIPGPPQNISGVVRNSNGIPAAAGDMVCVDDGQGPPGLVRVPWGPPGIRRPWPPDEYIFDGGDDNSPAVVDPNWQVRGLDIEDTIVHFDTLEGRTVVKPSNRVPIYAPRFASVRKVTGIRQHEQADYVAGERKALPAVQQDELQVATTAIQPRQPVAQVGRKSLVTFRDRNAGIGVDNAQRLIGFHDGFLPHEDFQIIKLGIFQADEKARLAQSTDAAITWTGDQAVQVIIDDVMAIESAGNSKPQAAYEYKLPKGRPCVRVVKVASKQDALPGEVIDFTLRFDNIGDQLVGNVTLLDNLSPRLEYVPNTAQCSVGAEFFTQENESESLVLRWEIKESLKPGQGGIIRFQCKVR